MPASIGPSPPNLTSPSRPPIGKRKITSKTVQRPTTLSRKSTAQGITKLGVPKKDPHREEPKHDDDDESFLNFCATCEKQLASSNNNFLYCSESCRQQDRSSSLTALRTMVVQAPPQPHIPFSSSSRLPSPPLSPFATYHSSFLADGPDIVARASPTTARPRSYFGSDPTIIPLPTPLCSSYAVSMPSNYYTGHLDPLQNRGSTTALASLRQLSSALDFAASNSKRNHQSRASSDSRSSIDSSSEENLAEASESSLTRSSSGVWSYMTNSARASRDQISRTYSTQSVAGLNGEVKPKTPKERGTSYSERATGNIGRLEVGVVRGVDRPLPPRTATSRPRSIDLLMPYTG